MADQPARQDPNLFPALIAHTGTAGTAETVRLVATAAGALNTSGGTNVNVVTGTVTSLSNLAAGTVTSVGTVLGIGGTVTVTGGGGGTQFDEDAVHSSGAGGNLVLAVRTDGGTALAADGDYHVLETDANGALRVSGTVTTGAGTQPVRIIDGTVTSISNVAAGTITRIEGGTITVTNPAGTQFAEDTQHTTGDGGNMLLAVRQDTASALAGSTGDYIPLITDGSGRLHVADANSGTFINISTGTQQTLGTVQNLNNGSINVLTGTITSITNLAAGTVTSVGTVLGIGGTVNVTGGGGGVEYAEGTAPVTITLKAIGYEDSGGTLRVPSPTNQLPVVSTGTVLNTGTTVNIATGTQQTLGTVGVVNTGTLAQVTLVPTVTTVSNVTNGSINILTGTIQSSGTTTGVGVVSNLTNGSVNILSGSLVGTFVNNGGSVTVQGVGGTGVAAVGNPVLMAGVDSGGTTYRMLVDTAGNPQVDVVTIPQVSVGTLPTLNLTTGTITTGSLSNVAMLNAGTVNASLVSSTGTIPLVTTVSNLTNGSINLLTGTVTSVTSVANLVAGTVTRVEGGTVGLVTTVSNLTNGSVNVLTGTVTSVTNLAGGTAQINMTPVSLGTPLTTLGTTGAAVWGTLVAAAGAGTRQYISGLAVVVASGTVDVAITDIGIGGSAGAGVLARGQFVPGGGIQRTFNPVIASGANGTLSYWLGGAGTVAMTVDYWQGV